MRILNKGSSLGQRKTNPRCQCGEAGGMKGIEGQLCG